MTNTNQTMPGMDEYRRSIDDLHFSDEAKERIAARLADAAAPTNRAPVIVPARRKRLPLAAAVAALVITLTLGGVAYATGSLVSLQQFVNHLFGKDAKVEVVDTIGRPVGVAQSVNGVTVSADAIIGDQNSLAVVFSISKDDGTPFEGIEPLDNGLLPLSFSSDLDVDFPLLTQVTRGMGSTGSSYFFDANPADRAIQLVETRSFTGADGLSLAGRTMTAHFGDLTLFGNDERTVIAPGEWTLTFPIEYEDSSVELPAGQDFELEGFYEDDAAGIREQVGPIAATVDELSVSPIALHLRYTVKQQVSWTSGESGRQSEHDAQMSNLLLSVPMSITMRDGSVFELADYAGGAISAEGEVAHCETGVFFDRIVDLDELASITIGGTTIEL